MGSRILVVEDEGEIADLIEVFLKNEDFEVLKCLSAAEGLEREDLAGTDLALLDIMLPGMDGFELCRRLRENYTFPIIMLTAKEEETDKITGLMLGADDYVTKPFRPLELMARVKAQLRRYQKYSGKHQEDGEEEKTLKHLGLSLDLKSYECRLDGEKITLTPTEFAILRILLERKGRVVSSEELFHAVWQDEYYQKNNNTITVHVRHIREKLGDNVEEPKFIKTVWGVGYKI